MNHYLTTTLLIVVTSALLVGCNSAKKEPIMTREQYQLRIQQAVKIMRTASHVTITDKGAMRDYTEGEWKRDTRPMSKVDVEHFLNIIQDSLPFNEKRYIACRADAYAIVFYDQVQQFLTRVDYGSKCNIVISNEPPPVGNGGSRPEKIAYFSGEIVQHDALLTLMRNYYK